MADRPRRGNAAAAVRALDPYPISLSAGTTLACPSRFQSSPSAAAYSTCFPTLSHTSVINAARRLRVPLVALMVVLSLLAVRWSWGHKWKPLQPMAMPTWPTWRSVSHWYSAKMMMLAAQPALLPLKLKRRPLQPLKPLLPAASVAMVAGVESSAAVERVEAKAAAQQAQEATLRTLQHKRPNTHGLTSMFMT